MAIIDPVSDVFTPLLSTTAQAVVFPSTNTSDFESGIDALLARNAIRSRSSRLTRYSMKLPFYC